MAKAPGSPAACGEPVDHQARCCPREWLVVLVTTRDYTSPLHPLLAPPYVNWSDARPIPARASSSMTSRCRCSGTHQSGRLPRPTPRPTPQPTPGGGDPFYDCRFRKLARDYANTVVLSTWADSTRAAVAAADVAETFDPNIRQNRCPPFLRTVDCDETSGGCKGGDFGGGRRGDEQDQGGLHGGRIYLKR